MPSVGDRVVLEYEPSAGVGWVVEVNANNGEPTVIWDKGDWSIVCFDEPRDPTYRDPTAWLRKVGSRPLIMGETFGPWVVVDEAGPTFMRDPVTTEHGVFGW